MVVAGVVPVMLGGSVPLLMAGTRPAMTISALAATFCGAGT
jgi:hypothetical protein